MSHEETAPVVRTGALRTGVRSTPPLHAHPEGVGDGPRHPVPDGDIACSEVMPIRCRYCKGTYVEAAWAMGEPMPRYCRGCGRTEQA